MQIQFSPQDTGACPLCKKNGSCTVQNSITTAYNDIGPQSKHVPMELVIYVCPYFIEKA